MLPTSTICRPILPSKGLRIEFSDTHPIMWNVKSFKIVGMECDWRIVYTERRESDCSQKRKGKTFLEDGDREEVKDPESLTSCLSQTALSETWVRSLRELRSIPQKSSWRPSLQLQHRRTFFQPGVLHKEKKILMHGWQKRGLWLAEKEECKRAIKHPQRHTRLERKQRVPQRTKFP